MRTACVDWRASFYIIINFYIYFFKKIMLCFINIILIIKIFMKNEKLKTS